MEFGISLKGDLDFKLTVVAQELVSRLVPVFMGYLRGSSA